MNTAFQLRCKQFLDRIGLKPVEIQSGADRPTRISLTRGAAGGSRDLSRRRRRGANKVTTVGGLGLVTGLRGARVANAIFRRLAEMR